MVCRVVVTFVLASEYAGDEFDGGVEVVSKLHYA